MILRDVISWRTKYNELGIKSVCVSVCVNVKFFFVIRTVILFTVGQTKYGFNLGTPSTL